MLTKTLKLSVWNGDPNCTIFCLLYFFRPNPAFLSIFGNLQCLHFSPANRLFAISDTFKMEWTNVALYVFYLCGYVYNYNYLFSISVDYVGTGIHQARRSYSRNMGFRMVLFLIPLVCCNSDKPPENHFLEELSIQKFQWKLKNLEAMCTDREAKLISFISFYLFLAH